MKQFKTALVTGGAGFIGSNIVRRLLDKGMDVVVVDDLSTGKRENVPDVATFIESDILDGDRLHQILLDHEIEVVFHEAAHVSIRNSFDQLMRDTRTNVLGTVSVLNSCRETAVRKIIFASSMAVYADTAKPEPVTEDHLTKPISAYGISKLAAEKYCLLVTQQMGISCVVLRYFNTYGIGQALTPYVGVITIFVHKLLRGETIDIFGDGEQRRDFIHVSDVTEANIRAMERSLDGETINVGTGAGTSVKELASMLISRISPGIKPNYVERRPEEHRNSIAEMTKAKRLLSFSPKECLARRINEVVDHYRQESVRSGSS